MDYEDCFRDLIKTRLDRVENGKRYYAVGYSWDGEKLFRGTKRECREFVARTGRVSVSRARRFEKERRVRKEQRKKPVAPVPYWTRPRDSDEEGSYSQVVREVLLEGTYPVFESPEASAALVADVRAVTAEAMAAIRRDPRRLFELSSRAFEEFVAELLASFGWEVTLTAATCDGGYDILGISKDRSGCRTSWIVECKRYARSRRVGIGVARALFGVKTARGIANAMIATTSYFSSPVQQFARSRYDFELRDYGNVVDWIREYKQSPSGLWIPKDAALA